jgi:hypothetical protein
MVGSFIIPTRQDVEAVEGPPKATRFLMGAPASYKRALPNKAAAFELIRSIRTLSA